MSLQDHCRGDPKEKSDHESLAVISAPVDDEHRAYFGGFGCRNYIAAARQDRLSRHKTGGGLLIRPSMMDKDRSHFMGGAGGSCNNRSTIACP
jgi:hypothetical protein